MSSRIFSFVVLSLIFIVLQSYTYVGLRSLISNERYVKWFNIFYGLQVLFTLACMYFLFQGLMSGAIVRSASINFYIGYLFTISITMLVFSSGMAVQDIGRLLVGIYQWVVSFFTSNEVAEGTAFLPSRRDFLSKGSLVIAAVPFFSLIYGITKGKYNYFVEKVQLAFGDLPKAFHGLKVVQISDVHSGSFDNIHEVERGIDMINDLNPDVILFTGDLVNSQKEEIDPYIEIFAKLKAKMGKFAVLGNHDYYGTYGIEGAEEKEAYTKDFHARFEKMGFKLLKNESTFLEKDGEKIALVGVENWGAGRWFPKEGDLDKALTNVADTDFTLLMSHDPTHWDQKVLEHPKHIHLTMSGHTHGMQFGIDIPGFKWSPVKYRYNRWMGLYQEKDQYLYVNRGFGFLGFPGRVGIWPEITEFELVTA